MKFCILVLIIALFSSSAFASEKESLNLTLSCHVSLHNSKDSYNLQGLVHIDSKKSTAEEFFYQEHNNPFYNTGTNSWMDNYIPSLTPSLTNGDFRFDLYIYRLVIGSNELVLNRSLPYSLKLSDSNCFLETNPSASISANFSNNDIGVLFSYDISCHIIRGSFNGQKCFINNNK